MVKLNEKTGLMSYLKPKPNYLQLSVVVAIVFCFTSSSTFLFAQSDTRQDSPTSAPQDPFDTPDDPFEVPEVPTAPTQDQPVVNPNAMVFQDALVDEKYAGWRQASEGTGPDRLDEILRAQWVMADDRGTVRGTVYGIEDADLGNLEISLLGNGRLVTSTTPKEDGTFQFANVKQGTYALVAWGDNAFFAFGLNILNYNAAADESMPMSLEVTAVPNKTTINTDWIKYFAGGVKFPVYGRFETEQGEDDPPRLYGTSGQQLYLPAARPATSISSHQVIPASNGRLIGRVHQITTRDGRPVDLRGTRILLLQNDDVYGAVSCDSYGVFEFPEIPAGEYACVAVGQDGLGCIGITVAAAGTVPPSPSVLEGEDEEEEFESDEPYTPISFAMMPSEAVGWLNMKAIDTAYQRIISTPVPYIDPDQQYYGNSCGNNYGGGCGSGRRAVRPGGYRPPPQNSVRKEDRFIPRLNRRIDRFFNRDTGQVPNSSGVGPGASFNGGFSGNSFGPALSAPAGGSSIAPSFSGSTSRNPIPDSSSKR